MRFRALGHRNVLRRFALLLAALLLLLPLAVDGQVIAETIPLPVPLGFETRDIALNPVTNRLYAIGFFPSGDKGILGVVVDVATNTATLLTAITSDPAEIAVNSETNKVYVVDAGLGSNGSLLVIDGITNAISRLHDPNASFPVSLAINSVTNKIYVANRYSGNISVFDGLTNSAVTITDPAAAGPAQVVVNELTNKIYVTNDGCVGPLPYCSNATPSITVIDGVTNAVTNLPDPSGYYLDEGNTLIVNPVTNKIYVGDRNGAKVIDGATLSTSMVANAPGVLQDFVLNVETNTILAKYYSVIDGDSSVLIDGSTDSARLLKFPDGIHSDLDAAVDAETNKFYVLGSNTAGQHVLLTLDGANPSNPFTSTSLGRANNGFVRVNQRTNQIYTLLDLGIDHAQLVILDGAGLMGPYYALSETNIPFGSRPIGLQGLKHVQLMTGSEAVEFASIKVTGQNPADFFYSSGTCPAVVAPASSCIFTITFQPTGIGLRTGTVIFTPKSGKVHQIVVSGPGALAIPAGPLSFDKPYIEWGPVQVGTVSTPIHIHVSNPNTGITANLTGVTLTGKNASDFRIVTNTCPGKIPFSHGAPACEVDLEFAPTAAGGRVTNLTFADNGSGPGQYIPIEGPAK